MHHLLDLFGQVVVTWPELYAWCERIAHIDPRSHRALDYLRAWNVAGKIAAAKLSGETFSDSFLQAVSRWEKENPGPAGPGEHLGTGIVKERKPVAPMRGVLGFSRRAGRRPTGV